MSEQEYIVTRVLKKRLLTGQKKEEYIPSDFEYEVEWEGYDYTTWEPFSHISHLNSKYFKNIQIIVNKNEDAFRKKLVDHYDSTQNLLQDIYKEYFYNCRQNNPQEIDSKHIYSQEDELCELDEYIIKMDQIQDQLSKQQIVYLNKIHQKLQKLEINPINKYLALTDKQQKQYQELVERKQKIQEQYPPPNNNHNKNNTNNNSLNLKSTHRNKRQSQKQRTPPKENLIEIISSSSSSSELSFPIEQIFSEKKKKQKKINIDQNQPKQESKLEQINHKYSKRGEISNKKKRPRENENSVQFDKKQQDQKIIINSISKQKQEKIDLKNKNNNKKNSQFLKEEQGNINTNTNTSNKNKQDMQYNLIKSVLSECSSSSNDDISISSYKIQKKAENQFNEVKRIENNTSFSTSSSTNKNQSLVTETSADSSCYNILPKGMQSYHNYISETVNTSEKNFSPSSPIGKQQKKSNKQSILDSIFSNCNPSSSSSLSEENNCKQEEQIVIKQEQIQQQLQQIQSQQKQQYQKPQPCQLKYQQKLGVQKLNLWKNNSEQNIKKEDQNENENDKIIVKKQLNNEFSCIKSNLNRKNKNIDEQFIEVDFKVELNLNLATQIQNQQQH